MKSTHNGFRQTLALIDVASGAEKIVGLGDD